MAKEDYLRMLRLAGKAAGNCYCLSHCGIAMQVVLTRFAYFAAGDEVGTIELFENDSHLRLMQRSCICCANAVPQFGQSHPSCVHLLLQSLQSDEAVRLDGDRLVELRGKGKADFQNIVGA